jgi:hypothetical protein
MNGLPTQVQEALEQIKYIESLPPANMERLSDRNIALLTIGGKTTGTMRGAYSYVEEQLYVDEALELYAFCEWVDDKIGGCSSHNMAGLFLAFKHPDNPVYKAFADNVKKQIDEINEMMKG